MILDSIQNAYKYENLHPLFAQAFAFLTNPDTSKLAVGKYPIKGDQLFARVFQYETKDESDALFEGHHHYIDIQFVQTGEEMMSYCHESFAKASEAFDDKNDIGFFQAKQSSQFVVPQGHFAIFFPNEIHKAGYHLHPAHDVHKILIKILFDLD